MPYVLCSVLFPFTPGTPESKEVINRKKAYAMAEPSTSSFQAHAPTGFPVQTKLYTTTICGHPTNFSFTRYTDQTLLLVTQIGTAGTLAPFMGIDAWVPFRPIGHACQGPLRAWDPDIFNVNQMIFSSGTMIQATQDAAFDGSTTYSTGK